jgi:hypothetical protein
MTFESRDINFVNVLGRIIMLIVLTRNNSIGGHRYFVKDRLLRYRYRVNKMHRLKGIKNGCNYIATVTKK